MSFLGVVLIVVFIATAILLVGVILIQDEQGEGLGGIFGGGSATPFGSRSGNVLTRFTTILGAIFLFCAFGIAWVNRSTQSGNVIAAAKQQQANQATAWWNENVSSNQTLPSKNGSTLPTATTQAPSKGSSSSLLPTSTGSGATLPGAKPAASGSSATTSSASSSGAASPATKGGTGG